jgi:hypothetical protein
MHRQYISQNSKYYSAYQLLKKRDVYFIKCGYFPTDHHVSLFPDQSTLMPLFLFCLSHDPGDRR